MPQDPDAPSRDPLTAQPAGKREVTEEVRIVLQSLARVIVSDRRAVALTSRQGEILLANVAARRLDIRRETLSERLDWADLCVRTRRAGSAVVTWLHDGQAHEGELVHVPLGSVESFMLRLSESDQEATLLRNRARAAMLMRVAHDLRTPIQSLLASAEVLTTQQPGTSLPADTAQQMRRAAELALDHVSNVLSVIRGEQNSRGGQPDEAFRIAEEVGALVAMITPIAEARATEISLQVDAPPDLTLHGPLRFVRALCQNLIDNSVNHGGGRVALRLECKPLAAGLVSDDAAEIWRVRLELCDEGGGLPPAHRARLAEALGLPLDDTGGQLAQPDARPSAGLNVLAHALRQLGGQIQIADRGSDGAVLPPGSTGRVIGTFFTVTFSLPAVQMRAALPEPSPENAILDGRCILLVEDSPASRDWLTLMLQRAGAEVISAGSGQEALALLSRNEIGPRVDLVLTDVTLPRMSGAELASRLQSGDPASAVTWRGRVVGLTAHADDRIRAACLAAGMVRVLEKPIQARALCGALRAVLDGATASAAVEKAVAAPAPGLLDPKVRRDLSEQLGLEPARGFMRRALAEARSVMEELRNDGVGADTGRRLHAATGASGLTGLRQVEASLRAIELAVETRNGDLAMLYERLEQAVSRTETAIGALT